MICPQCKTEFEAEYIVNEYGRRYLLSKWCSPFCKEEFEIKRREETRYKYDRKVEKTFPKWTCQECQYIIQLDFEPLKDDVKFSQLVCPKCNPVKM